MSNENISGIKPLKATTMMQTAIFDVQLADDNVEAGFRPILVKSKDWVSVIVKRGDDYLLVKQRRYGVNLDMSEFPCGMVEDRETSAEAAYRELKEETGIDLPGTTRDGKMSLTYLGCNFANPAFMTNKMSYFFADLDKIDKDGGVTYGTPAPDEHEQLTTRWVSEDELLKMLQAEVVSTFMTSAMHWLATAKMNKTVDDA